MPLAALSPDSVHLRLRVLELACQRHPDDNTAAFSFANDALAFVNATPNRVAAATEDRPATSWNGISEKSSAALFRCDLNILESPPPETRRAYVLTRIYNTLTSGARADINTLAGVLPTLLTMPELEECYSELIFGEFLTVCDGHLDLTRKGRDAVFDLLGKMR